MNQKIVNLIFGVVGSAVLAHAPVAAGANDDAAVAAKAATTVSFEDWYARNASRIANRNALVGAVMQNLQPDLQRLGASIDEKSRLQVMLHNMPTATLERATALTKVADAEALAMGAGDPFGGGIRGTVQTKALGDINQDLVFIPHGPCRIVDTRGSAAGAITGGTARAFKNYSATGQGVTGSCNVGGSGTGVGYLAGSGGAIALTVTGVPPGATGSLYGNTGFLTARPVGDTNLTATVLIEQGTPFTAANSTIIKTSIGANDFEVYAAITSHVVVDLLGFYVPAAPSALDCQSVYATTATTVTAGSEVCADPPACPAGFAATATLFDSDAANSIVISQLNLDPVAPSILVCAKNLGAASHTFSPGRRCCRTPGTTANRF